MNRKRGMHIPALEAGIANLLRCMVDIPCSFKLSITAVDFLQFTQVIVWLNIKF